MLRSAGTLTSTLGADGSDALAEEAKYPGPKKTPAPKTLRPNTVPSHARVLVRDERCCGEVAAAAPFTVSDIFASVIYLSVGESQIDIRKTLLCQFRSIDREVNFSKKADAAKKPWVFKAPAAEAARVIIAKPSPKPENPRGHLGASATRMRLGSFVLSAGRKLPIYG